jgi:hypothetical protein
MTKQEQFLWKVQTVILANGINLSSQKDCADKYRHDYSATGVLWTASEALYFSERIPEELSAADAADEFCGHMLTNLREDQGGRPLVPQWLART